MRTFKTINAARDAAQGLPILRIRGDGENLYVVFERESEVGVRLAEVSVVSNREGQGGHITGHVTVGHLDRLGNANWALAAQPSKSSAFSEAARVKR